MAATDERETVTKIASRPMTGADVLVESLVQHRVDVVFAYPGGASMPMHQALTRFRQQIRTILPRHEQGGIFAAEGYARATGKPGVVMATSGPGASISSPVWPTPRWIRSRWWRSPAKCRGT